MQKKNPSRIILTLHKNPCNTWLCFGTGSKSGTSTSNPNSPLIQFNAQSHRRRKRKEDIITLEAEGVTISITEEALTQTQQPSNFHNTTINTTVPHFQSSSRPTCQICYKMGHTAIDCYHRMDFAFQGKHPPPKLAAMAFSSNASTSNCWVSDTGATDHFTPDLANLQQPKDYNGNDGVTDIPSGKVLYKGLSEAGLYPIYGDIFKHKSPPSVSFKSAFNSSVKSSYTSFKSAFHSSVKLVASALTPWITAMKDEFSALHRQGTWTLVPSCSFSKYCGLQMRYTRSNGNVDGSVSRYKARLVAKGFHQQAGLDYDETFSPSGTLAMHFFTAISKRMSLWLNHKGFVDPSKPDYVCKLHKSLYGLKQAPKGLIAGPPLGYVVFLGSTPITWVSKKQCTISRYLYRKLNIATLLPLLAEVFWIRIVLKDLGIFIPDPPLLWCDNLFALALASNPVFHALTKHIEVDYHFVREKVVCRDVVVKFISTT
uniref:Reverse transcriptase Ty1/copia-type domain-containing protein n=1 Tax=Fagus sylvatica TaxID=28930 RepID=A0A2N9F9H0_FAGSY